MPKQSKPTEQQSKSPGTSDVPKKLKSGRPKESLDDKVDYALVEKYASLGLTDEEIGFLIGVTERTVNRYKDHPDFLSALKRGKLKADTKVVQSLFRRATGFETKETTLQLRGKGKNKMLVATKVVTKQVAPETVACIYWTKNRRRKDWSGNPDNRPPDSGAKSKVLIIEDEK